MPLIIAKKRHIASPPVGSSWEATVLGLSPNICWLMKETSGTALAPSGSIYDGTIYGGASVGSPGAIASDAAYKSVPCDGVNDYISSTICPFSINSQRSAIILVKRNGLLLDSLFGSSQGYAFCDISSPDRNPATPGRTVFWSPDWGSNSSQWIDAFPNDTNWHLVGLNVDDASSTNNVELFIDGVSKGQRSNAGTYDFMTQFGTIRLGAWDTGYPPGFLDGSIGGFAMYNTILTAGNHADLYTGVIS